MFFGIAPKCQKSEDKSNLGGPGGLFRSLLASCFHYFCEWPTIQNNNSFQYVLMVLHHKKYIAFRSLFNWFFMFFQNRCWGMFLQGLNAELVWKVWFGCHVRFWMIFKKTPLGRPFRTSCIIKSKFFVPRASLPRPCFSRSTIITVPLGPTGFQKVAFWSKIEQFSFCFYHFYMC